MWASMTHLDTRQRSRRYRAHGDTIIFSILSRNEAAQAANDILVGRRNQFDIAHEDNSFLEVWKSWM